MHVVGHDFQSNDFPPKLSGLLPEQNLQALGQRPYQNLAAALGHENEVVAQQRDGSVLVFVDRRHYHSIAHLPLTMLCPLGRTWGSPRLAVARRPSHAPRFYKVSTFLNQLDDQALEHR